MIWQVVTMSATEASRLDLYNGLVDLLGRERADTLMASLPPFDIDQIATKTDLRSLGDRLDSRIDRLESVVERLREDQLVLAGDLHDGLAMLDGRMDRLEGRMDGLNGRMDRFFLSLLAGLFVVIAAMATAVIAALGA